MKKFMIALLVMVGLVSVSHVSLAERWVVVNQSPDYQISVDADSVKVLRYAPPIYIIEGMQKYQMFIRGKGTTYTLRRYLYNYDTAEIKFHIVATKEEIDTRWHYLKHQDEWGHTSTKDDVANMMFKLAYNMDFHR